VDRRATLETPCPPEAVFAWVDDLARYPAWLPLVTRVEPDGGSPQRPGWLVDLRGRLGPLARSKRLRMARTAWEPGTLAVFERDERDGRDHSVWVLRAEVTARPAGSRLSMDLHYGGRLWGPVLERLLGEEIARAQVRLAELVASGGTA
jgi:hypothetical protein